MYFEAFGGAHYLGAFLCVFSGSLFRCFLMCFEWLIIRCFLCALSGSLLRCFVGGCFERLITEVFFGVF